MAQDELAYAPAWRLSERIQERSLSSVELTRHLLERIERYNPRLNAFLTVVGDQALAEAERADEQLIRGEAQGALHGIPLSIKDLVATKGIRTTRGSRVFQDDVPDQDDILVERVRAAGAIILGKTNTPEFGHRGTTENLLGDACRNPWNLERTAGGSSGGAAAALAAGLGPLATGSDGGGSIRIPAAFCGVFGIKPTQGRVPRLYATPGGWGMFSQNGPMGRDVRDVALLLQVMAGPDPRDPSSIKEAAPDFLRSLTGDVRGLRIAWSPDYGYAPVAPDVREAAEQAAKSFEALGAHVEEAAPSLDGARMRELFRTVFIGDYVANYGHLLETHSEELTPLLREWMEEAREWRADRVLKALRELEWHRYRMARFFDTYDLLLSPTLAVDAFPIEEWPDTIDGQIVDPYWGFTPFTYPVNMSWGTAASVPCGFSRDGLPIGLHIVGDRGKEEMVLRACAVFEAARPWADQIPPGFAE